MDDQIPIFLSVTGIEDESIAKQFLELTNGDLEYAVTLYMESGGQHQQGAPTSTSNHNTSASSAQDDEELARKLQQEAYADSGEPIREADANVHRHETLVDPTQGLFHPQQFQNRPVDVFGNRREGIFHQRYTFDNSDGIDMDDDDDHHDNFYSAHDNEDHDDDDDDNDHIQSYHDSSDDGNDDSDRVRIIPINRRSRARLARDAELTSTQRRLANLFRPPFDLMSMISLEQARSEATQARKWILINIQDSQEFQCQVMNRDFWSNDRIKSIVKDNFILLQYQSDSSNGEQYVNFYHADAFPHLAILDPLTGERLKQWPEGIVPNIDNWIKDVNDFLDQFSVGPDSTNPIVTHEPRIDPDSLTEEQQIELAMKRSMQQSSTLGTSADDAIVVDGDSDDDNQEEDMPEISPSPPAISAEDEVPLDPFDAIKPIDHPEPTEQPFTRVQIRFPNGKRLVRKLQPNDKVIVIFEWLKNVLATQGDQYGLEPQDRFILSNSSNKSFKFIDSLDLSIEEAMLKNASILLEKD